MTACLKVLTPSSMWIFRVCFSENIHWSSTCGETRRSLLNLRFILQVPTGVCLRSNMAAIGCHVWPKTYPHTYHPKIWPIPSKIQTLPFKWYRCHQLCIIITIQAGRAHGYQIWQQGERGWQWLVPRWLFYGVLPYIWAVYPYISNK